LGDRVPNKTKLDIEVLIVMTIKSTVFCDVRHEVCQNFTDILEKRVSSIFRIEEQAKLEIRENITFLAGMYCLHFQGRRVSEARNEKEQGCFLLASCLDFCLTLMTAAVRFAEMLVHFY
jgi:hypothetical protein